MTLTHAWKELAKRQTTNLKVILHSTEDIVQANWELCEENEKLRKEVEQVCDRILDRAKLMLEEGSLSEAEFGAICAVVLVSDRELSKEEYNFPSELVVQRLKDLE